VVEVVDGDDLVVEVVDGVLVVVGAGAVHDSDSLTTGAFTGSGIEETGVPGVTLTVNCMCWPVARVTVITHVSADAGGAASAAVTSATALAVRTQRTTLTETPSPDGADTPAPSAHGVPWTIRLERPYETSSAISNLNRTERRSAAVLPGSDVRYSRLRARPVGPRSLKLRLRVRERARRRVLRRRCRLAQARRPA
jgi:hypothetical protein